MCVAHVYTIQMIFYCHIMSHNYVTFDCILCYIKAVNKITLKYNYVEHCVETCYVWLCDCISVTFGVYVAPPSLNGVGSAF